MKGKCNVCKIVGLFVVIGALNWGLVGAFQVDLVAKLLGEMSVLSRIVYLLVGLSCVICLISCFKDCPACKKA